MKQPSVLQILLKFLACVLVSEAWSNEEIDAEILDFREEILHSATESIDIITSVVYPVIDGCNKARLAYVFAQISDCYLHLAETQDLAESSIKLGQFYRVLGQECFDVSFITDLNFKNIVDVNFGSLNSDLFNHEICQHVNEFTVEALAKMVQALHSTITGASSKNIMFWQDVYKHHVQTLLKNLEYKAKKIRLENPESLLNLLSELEQTYDACRKYIRILDHQSALIIMNKFFNGVVPLHVFKEIMHLSLKDCLIVLLNFWVRLNADLVEIAENLERSTAVSLMICFKVFMKLVVDGKVSQSQGWEVVYFFVDSAATRPSVDYCSFCRSMVLSGCTFSSVEAVFSEAFSECSIDLSINPGTKGGVSCSPDVCNLYLNILESILSNLVHDNGERQKLHNLLSSISGLDGDLETLKRVRTAVWERIAKFSDNLQLPSHIRVYALEVLQYILGRKGKISTEQEDGIIPWESWDDWSATGKSSELTEEQVLQSQAEGTNRFKNTLVALKTTELAGSISSHLEISADDLQTVDSAVSCFTKFCGAADSHAHFEALLAVLGEWESLFLAEKTNETSVEVSGASDPGINWSDDWDEAWESFHDEEPVVDEYVKPSISIHPLHKCWMEILWKLVMLSRFDEVVKLIDQSLVRSDIVLITEDDAINLSNMLIDSDSFMALKASLLLPYRTLHLRCLDAVEKQLKQGDNLENIDMKFLILVLSSGIISSIISKSEFRATFSYTCYLVGVFSRQSQNALVSSIHQNMSCDDDESFNSTFRRVLFPCFVAELVKANQQILAGFLVTKYMHTNPSLCLLNVAEVGLRRYLQSHVQLLESHDSSSEATKPEILRQTLTNLEGKSKTLICSALSSLSNSS